MPGSARARCLTVTPSPRRSTRCARAASTIISAAGFSRYSTDARWLVPHFEKMLYDNAELVDLLTLVWQETRNPLYQQRVEETLEWVRREMLTQEGGFASSLDADSEHEEGKFYVWSEAEIDALLGKRAPLFKRFYDVEAQGNWEGHTILNRLKAPALADAETERELASCRTVLFQAREPRVHPGFGRTRCSPTGTG